MKPASVPFFLMLALALGLSSPLSAASQDVASLPSGQYILDKSHASLLFRVNHLGFSMYHARFNKFDARLNFDAKEPEKSLVEATIDVASVDANNPKMDEHLKNEDFFNVAKFPAASFKSIKTTRSGNSGTMVGELTLMGVTKPVTLNVTFHGGGAHPKMTGTTVLGFGARTTIKRSEWGMTYGVPMVGDEVSIEIEAEFHKADAAAAPAGDKADGAKR